MQNTVSSKTLIKASLSASIVSVFTSDNGMSSTYRKFKISKFEKYIVFLTKDKSRI